MILVRVPATDHAQQKRIVIDLPRCAPGLAQGSIWPEAVHIDAQRDDLHLFAGIAAADVGFGCIR